MMSKRVPSLYSLASFLLAMLVFSNTQRIVLTLRILTAKHVQDRVKGYSLDRRQFHKNPPGTLSMSSATPFISSNNNNSSSSFGMKLSSNTVEAYDKGGSQQQIARIPMSEDDLREMMDNSSGEKNIRLLQNRAKGAENNKYFNMVEKLAPNEMLAKFAVSAPENVQEAARSTIMNILGSLPTYALEASLFTTNTKLANLMFQVVTSFLSHFTFLSSAIYSFLLFCSSRCRSLATCSKTRSTE